MGCGDEKLSKYLTQTFTAHCNAMICQQVTLSGDAEWPKVADAVIEAELGFGHGALQAEHQPIVQVRQIINRIRIADQRLVQTANLGSVPQLL